MTLKSNKSIVMSLFIMVVPAFSYPIPVDAAPQSAAGYWKLAEVIVQEIPTSSTETVACSREGSCESTQTGGNGSLICKVSHNWSKPTEKLAPNENIPVNFELTNLRVQGYHGGRASLDAKLWGQG